MSEKMPREVERLNTIIGQGTVIKGECSVSGTVRVDGIIDGSLSASGVAILGKSGEVRGDMEVGNAIVGGKVDGSVLAQGRLELQSGARVEGDISAKRLVVEEGVFFQGFCNMEKKGGDLREEKLEELSADSEAALQNEASRTRKIEVEEAGKGESDEDITFHGERA